ncbi:MAG TPA: DEAD/DEAH box helicase [Candidatus Paceibacterota bacterium]|nr:DEAD/DEAH box helicase [Verrucomicrobiota bacterium]HSA13014.1 DEAD/DEAH box helicase [Candidatus Paceibacterota bacterium]
MILRPYQSAASDAIFKEWQENDSTLVVMPTGGGKTILFADVIRRVFPRRALVIAHREELIFQARDKIQRVTGLSADVEMGEYRAEGGLFGSARVVVSTIQTQCSGGDGGGRMAKFDPSQFGLLIIDEAHHATSPTYRRVIDYYRTNPALKVLGVTATPDRADEEALGQVFESVAFDYEVLDAIHDGWLVPIEQQMVHVEGLDYSSIRTTAGDLNGGDLAAVMEAERNLQPMASASLAIIGQRRALVFTSSVKAAEMTAEIFNRHRPEMASWVCGKTEREERRRVLADFAAGKVQVVCNCGVLTEGFDDPGVEVVIMGRPTKSRSLYSQMVGRSTRPLPGVVDGPETGEARKAAIAASAKPSCLVVDFVGNAGRHKLITSADILGGKVSEEALERAVKRVSAAGGPVNMTEALDEAETELREQKRLAEAARRANLVAKARFTTQSVDPFDVLHLDPVKPRGWDAGRQLTEKQRSLLAKQGINPDGISFAEGRQLISEIFRRWNGKLCSFKQAKVLRKYGYDTEVSFAEASATIDALARNGWHRVPAGAPAKGDPAWN